MSAAKTDLSEAPETAAPPEARSILARPAFIWVLLAFLVSFYLFFIRPVFLNDWQIQLFPNFPAIIPIGGDLREYLTFSQAILTRGTPYIGQNYYPPFEALFFLPWTNLKIDDAYNLMTAINFALFVALTAGLPLLLGREKRLNNLLILMLVTGLFSYGFIFQLERGQYDLIVMLFCFASMVLYHYHPRWGWLAYALFTISVQLKIYPAIFLITFVTDWRDWKHNLRRWGLIGLANLAGLFILGPQVFLEFVSRLTGQMARPTFVTIENLSIYSFVRVTADGYREALPWLERNSGLIQYALMALFFILFFLIWFQVYRRNLSGLNPYLLLACAVGMMVIPSTSHDYKLAIFAAPVAVFLNALDLEPGTGKFKTALQVGLVFFISLAYFFCLYPASQKPLIYRSNFPNLMAILTGLAALMWLRARLLDRSAHPASFPDLT